MNIDQKVVNTIRILSAEQAIEQDEENPDA